MTKETGEARMISKVPLPDGGGEYELPYPYRLIQHERPWTMMCFMCSGSFVEGLPSWLCGCWLSNNGLTLVRLDGLPLRPELYVIHRNDRPLVVKGDTP